MRAVNAIMPSGAGRLPSIVPPARYWIPFAAASITVTTAPTVTARGRSPGSSGSSWARTAAFLASERDSRDGRGVTGLGAGFTATFGSLRRFLLRLPTDRLPAQHLGGGARIVRVANRANNGDAFGADLPRPPGVDAADREPRLAHVLLGVADELEADRRDARLRCRLVHGSDAQVVDGRIARRCVDLRRRVRREADEHLRSHRGANVRDRLVVLADVHAVGIAGESKVRPVVHHEQRVVLVAQLAQPAAARHDLLVGRVLLAELHDVHAALQSRRH